MPALKEFDLNKVPDSCSSSEASNGKTEETCHEEEVMKIPIIDLNKHPKEDPHSVPSVCFEIINRFRSSSKNSIGEKTNSPSYDKAGTKVSARKASTTEIIQLARKMFMQPRSEKANGFSFVGFSEEEIREAQLVHLLLASADKVGEQQYVTARQLIKQCYALSSRTGTSVQRLVHHFADALQVKINKDAGGSTSMSNSSGKWTNMSDLRESLLNPNTGTVAYYLKNPFYQIVNFTAVQIITEHVREAKRVHFITLEIYMGQIFSILMEDLASRSYHSLEHLKITAVGTKKQLEDTGKRLYDSAKSLNLSFTFKAVVVEDLLELNKDRLELDDDEQVAIYSAFALSSMIPQPARLGSFMKIIREINPRVTVISEIELNHNSNVFINRFMACLVYCSAVFDSVATCAADEASRIRVECQYFDLIIRNIVGAGGVVGAYGPQGIDKWRELFAGFGMMEIGLSIACLDQANLLLRTLEHGSSCTLKNDGKCLLVGWKGVPFSSLSAWKFQ